MLDDGWVGDIAVLVVHSVVNVGEMLWEEAVLGDGCAVFG